MYVCLHAMVYGIQGQRSQLNVGRGSYPSAPLMTHDRNGQTLTVISSKAVLLLSE